MDFTAIILSAKPVKVDLPGVTVLPHVRKLLTPDDLHEARLDALADVKTPYCFFLDDDDLLPDDYEAVLADCRELHKNVPLVYTDELVRMPTGGERYAVSGPYDAALHAQRPEFIHHLATMETTKAQGVAARLPRGRFWTEQLLYWSLAREGAAYLPRVGYIWNKGITGFHRNPRTLTAQANSMSWIALMGSGK